MFINNVFRLFLNYTCNVIKYELYNALFIYLLLLLMKITITMFTDLFVINYSSYNYYFLFENFIKKPKNNFNLY